MKKMGMLPVLKRSLSSEFVKVSFQNSIATIIRMCTGLISVKVVATIIGPAGIALLGQLQNFTSIVLSISNGGINAGITKYVSEHSEIPGEYSRYLRTGFWITIVLSVIMSAVITLFAPHFSLRILHDQGYTSIFYVFAGTLTLYALNAFLAAVVNGFREYRRFLIANIMGSVIGLLISVLLTFKAGVYGALLASVTFQSVVFFVTLIIVFKAKWFKWRHFIGNGSRIALINLGHYSLMAIASAVTIPSGQLIVRNMIVKYRNLPEAGIWEGMNRISSMYLMVVTTSMSVYYLPKLSSLKSVNETRTEVRSVYRLVIPFLLVITTIIYSLREVIIKILFTREFYSMSGLFKYQLIGDFLKISGFVLGFLLIARKMTRIYVTMEIVNFILLCIVSYSMVPRYGAVGASISYSIVYFLYLIVLLYVFRRTLFTQKESLRI